MFDEIKKYSMLYESLRNSNNKEELISLKDQLNNYETIDIPLKHNDISKILNKLGFIDNLGIYISYPKEINNIEKKREGLNLGEITYIINKEFPIVEKTGSLYYYIVSKDNPYIFIQIHYQDSIIIIYEKNMANINIT